MANIDYYGIKEALKKVVHDACLEHRHEISTEGNILFDNFDNLVDIEIESREVASAPMAEGTRAKYNLLIVLTIWSKNLEKSTAIKIRDEMISELEVYLMKNRTLNGKVDSSWLLGGQNVVAFIEDESAFVAAGEIQMNVESEIIT